MTLHPLTQEAFVSVLIRRAVSSLHKGLRSEINLPSILFTGDEGAKATTKMHPENFPLNLPTTLKLLERLSKNAQDNCRKVPEDYRNVIEIFKKCLDWERYPREKIYKLTINFSGVGLQGFDCQRNIHRTLQLAKNKRAIRKGGLFWVAWRHQNGIRMQIARINEFAFRCSCIDWTDRWFNWK